MNANAIHMIPVSINDQAVNDENGEVNVAFDHDHDPAQPATDTIPGVAKKFRRRGQPWALVVDENYGEGSAREHAALQPRFYGRLHAPCHPAFFAKLLIGCAMIVARSFARIHETNLKVAPFVFLLRRILNVCWHLQKQGILPLWFADRNDYGRIGSGAVVETVGVHDLISGKPDAVVRVKVTTRAGESFEIPTKHTMSSDQLKWLRAGSALNYIRSQLGKR
jgi:homoaconitase